MDHAVPNSKRVAHALARLKTTQRQCLPYYHRSSGRALFMSPLVYLALHLIWPPLSFPFTMYTPALAVFLTMLSTDGYGSCVIPKGTLTGVHFVQMSDFVQVTDKGDLTKPSPLAIEEESSILIMPMGMTTLLVSWYSLPRFGQVFA
ncbi:hypothetical protein ARMSODRAFT_1026437 [Armillaria solidipes]|uniref:Uncharacterized protein n=1 Tax=Armillaria solidipes TaxID=1076256 RepID=A0A2H3ANZ3_9AGAR|nr:hypothetical protein ARMSODRAFT_1026437 [Armillaria solidipes]